MPSAAFTPRRNEKKMSADFYPTSPETTNAFLNAFTRTESIGGRIWEPAAGKGHMARVLEPYGEVIATDLHDYGYCEAGVDFIAPLNFRRKQIADSGIDCIITNPPFNQFLEFCLTALDIATDKVCMMAPVSKITGKKRWAELYRVRPASWIYVYSSRQPMLKGEVEGDSDKKSSRQVDYAWYVWDVANPAKEAVFREIE